MPRGKSEDLLKFNTVKRYINDNLNMRSTNGAIKRITGAIDSLTKAIIRDAKERAKEKRRNTIKEIDVRAGIENNIGKRELSWEETVDEIIKKSPADLGKVSKAINDFIKK